MLTTYAPRLLIYIFIATHALCMDYQNTDNPFSENFKWGAAICEFQNSGPAGCPDSNWTEFLTNKPFNGYTTADSSSNFLNRYTDDIQVMHELGINALRLSVDWSRVEPQEGIFNEEVLAHYETICDDLIAAGIDPMITLHHFTHPQWFEDRQGFEQVENIPLFIRFCKHVFTRLAPKVKRWCTINEPTIYALQGYIFGAFPPGKHNPYLAIVVLRTMLQAHVEAYTALKKLPHGESAEIGIAHQYLKFTPYTTTNPLERMLGYFLNPFLNDFLLDFFSTGRFYFKVPYLPIIPAIEYTAPEGMHMDFFGLNYYSRVVVKFQYTFNLSQLLVPSHHPGEVMTDMPYAGYAEGLYHSIGDIHNRFPRVPLYITENGISDVRDDRRAQFITDYLAALKRAVAEGRPVKGFYYWTLTDNLEWDMGYTQHFGLCSVDPVTKNRAIRTGALAYQTFIANHTRTEKTSDR